MKHKETKVEEKEEGKELPVKVETIELDEGDKLTKDIRIKEINYFDHWAMASSIESIVNKNLLSWEELKGGDIVKGEVKWIEGEKYAIVKLNEYIEGRVYWEHMSDIPLKKIPKSFLTNVGKKMKFKILSVDPKKKVIELTLKDLLIRGKKRMPTSFDDVDHGKKFSGVIVG